MNKINLAIIGNKKCLDYEHLEKQILCHYQLEDIKLIITNIQIGVDFANKFKLKYDFLHYIPYSWPAMTDVIYFTDSADEYEEKRIATLKQKRKRVIIINQIEN